jgi:enoyl-CoA hydratase/carnithine racemase
MVGDSARVLAPSTPLLVVTDGVATITLNRPAHRNRLEDADLQTLLAQFSQINGDPSIRVVVLTANTEGQPKPVFCAGYHLGGFDDKKDDRILFEKIPDAFAALRPITICALNGSVYGGATDLFIAADLRIALQDVELRMPATALGLHYYPSGLQRYVTRMGVSFTKRAFLTARPFSAKQLWESGCLEALVEGEAMAETLQSLVRDVHSLAPIAVQSTKQSILELSLGRYDLPTLRSREAITSESEDFAEGRKAFAERRTPHFNGR